MSPCSPNTENIAWRTLKLCQNDVWDEINNIVKIHPQKYQGCAYINIASFLQRQFVKFVPEL